MRDLKIRLTSLFYTARLQDHEVKHSIRPVLKTNLQFFVLERSILAETISGDQRAHISHVK